MHPFFQFDPKKSTNSGRSAPAEDPKPSLEAAPRPDLDVVLQMIQPIQGGAGPLVHLDIINGKITLDRYMLKMLVLYDIYQGHIMNITDVS